jgi:L-ascorbate metabolism protein UlaG (beta-lactamase superfamily)
MDVLRLAHAGIVVSAQGFRCLMDPMLHEPFEAGANLFEPPVAIDPALAAGCDALILSHAHGDHFAVASLVHLPRTMPVFYPAGDPLIPLALKRLGFEQMTPVSPGQTWALGPLLCTFTASEVPFAEMGVLFEHDGQTLWNCVDCVLGDRAFAAVAARTGALDVMLVPYQPLIEEPLWCDALGAGFPHDAYRGTLEAVRRAAPRCAVPSSCGYRYADAGLDARGFPVTEDEFLGDLALFAPEVAGCRLPPGTALACDELVLREEIPGAFERARAADRIERREWAPERGMPLLQDANPQGYKLADLRATVRGWLNGACLDGLARGGDWQARLAQARAVWRLEIVYPDGEHEVRFLDFAAAPSWVPTPARVPQIRTTVPASTVAGLLDGSTSTYRALFTRRVATKLRWVEAGRLTSWNGLADEPLGRLLFPEADRRHLEHELRRFGYGQRSYAFSRTAAFSR